MFALWMVLFGSAEKLNAASLVRVLQVSTVILLVIITKTDVPIGFFSYPI